MTYVAVTGNVGSITPHLTRPRYSVTGAVGSLSPKISRTLIAVAGTGTVAPFHFAKNEGIVPVTGVASVHNVSVVVTPQAPITINLVKVTASGNIGSYLASITQHRVQIQSVYAVGQVAHWYEYLNGVPVGVIDPDEYGFSPVATTGNIGLWLPTSVVGALQIPLSPAGSNVTRNLD